MSSGTSVRSSTGTCGVTRDAARHGDSQAEYDAQMQVLANRWLRGQPPREVYEFLHLSFAELHRIYGRVYGTRVPHPKLIRVSEYELLR